MVIDAQFTCDGQVVEASFFMFPGDKMIEVVARNKAKAAAIS
jgi:hypothetical protein